MKSTANAYVFAFCFLTLYCGVVVAHETGRCPGLPPNGFWSVISFATLPENDREEVAVTRKIVRLVRQTEVAYNGTGVGLVLIPIAGALPGDQISFNVLGVFNPDTCTLAATFTGSDGVLQDAINWLYDGQKMAGPVVGAVRGEVFPYPTRDEAEFLAKTWIA